METSPAKRWRKERKIDIQSCWDVKRDSSIKQSIFKYLKCHLSTESPADRSQNTKTKTLRESIIKFKGEKRKNQPSQQTLQTRLNQGKICPCFIISIALFLSFPLKLGKFRNRLKNFSLIFSFSQKFFTHIKGKFRIL